MNRLIRLLIALPALGAVWAAANSLGVTQFVEAATGYDIPSEVKIPGIKQIDTVTDFLDEKKAEARQEVHTRAVAALRKQVRQRYGADAVAYVPSNLTAAEAVRITKQVVGGAKLPAIKTSLAKAKRPGTQPGPGQVTGVKPGQVPFMNAGAYKKARKDLGTLPIKGKAAKTGYSRDFFGSAWSDTAGDFAWTRNGCDTRNDVLKRDLVKKTFDDGSTCDVATGVLPYDPYTGRKNRKFSAIDDEYSTDLDIEHVRALGDVYVHGGQKMTSAERAAIANDPLNLMAVDPSQNRTKGDADFASWLPPNKAYRCAYAARTIAVTKKYSDLWITSAEHDALARVLAGCA